VSSQYTDLNKVDVTPRFAEVFRSMLYGVDGCTGGWRCCWGAPSLPQSPPATTKNPPPYISLLFLCFCSDGSNQHKIWAAGGDSVFIWEAGLIIYLRLSSNACQPSTCGGWPFVILFVSAKGPCNALFQFRPLHDFTVLARQVLVQSPSSSRARSKRVVNQAMFDVPDPSKIVCMCWKEKRKEKIMQAVKATPHIN